jgi:hypothetical protein
MNNVGPSKGQMSGIDSATEDCQWRVIAASMMSRKRPLYAEMHPWAAQRPPPESTDKKMGRLGYRYCPPGSRGTRDQTISVSGHERGCTERPLRQLTSFQEQQTQMRVISQNKCRLRYRQWHSLSHARYRQNIDTVLNSLCLGPVVGSFKTV